MLLPLFIGLGFAPALAAGLLFRGRSLVLLGVGAAIFALACVYFLALADCPSDAHECTPELGALFAAFAFGGWIAGVLAAAGLTRLGSGEPTSPRG